MSTIFFAVRRWIRNCGGLKGSPFQSASWRFLSLERTLLCGEHGDDNTWTRTCLEVEKRFLEGVEARVQGHDREGFGDDAQADVLPEELRTSQGAQSTQLAW